MKKAFILGAGFSKSFCNDMPAINDLTDKLFDEKLQPQTEYPQLCDFIKNYYNKGSQSPAIRDIENISTAILSKKIFKNDAEKFKFEILRYQILKIIHDKIKGHNIDTEEKKTLLKRFVNLCNEGKNNTLITFNYDLLIESTDEWITYGVTNSYPATAIRQRLGGPTEYIKLHGSFNWFRAKGTTEQDMHYIYRVDKQDDEYSIHSDDVPVFIPMAHTKDSFLNGSLFNTLWAKASEALRVADEIYFLGYGFPTTDLSNLFYFLDYKEKIKKIVIFDNPESENYKRIKSIFGSSVVIKQDAFEFISNHIEQWEN